ncbi:Lrp/AsnC family transcriptional regulator [Alphaproteobacteria bacterium]|nr:Lrp/AsnC family transcriptional regulator [Alphaproteobacteria bacterium]
MRAFKLDKIDKMILCHLQDNGRMTNVELARNVGISAPPCLRRVRALEDNGYIKSYHAKVDRSVLGYHVTILAQVKLESQAEKDLLEFEELMNDLPMVRECHMLAGDVDFILKIVAKDWESYQAFLSASLTSARNVISVKSSLCVRSAKDIPGVPIAESA